MAIPVDGYRLFALDPRTLLVNRLLASSQEDAWARLEWLRECYLNELLRYVRHDFLMRQGLSAVAVQEFQELSWGLPGEHLRWTTPGNHQDRYWRMRSPRGGTMIVSFASRGRWVATLHLYRRDPHRLFRAQDVAFARSISRLCGEALAASLAKERAFDDPGGGPAASGVLIVDRAARIDFATPAGERWRDRLRDADPGGHAPLPTPVWSAMAALRASGTVGAVNVETVNGPVRIEATPAGAEDSVAVAILPIAPPPLPLAPPGWELSPREQAICALILRGATNRQIAGSLAMSENTVETHLRHIYAKTGVEGRMQIVAAFFRETLLPGLSER
ncbi:MAG: helix-turn-helix transcriptional regulator [Thermomicrobiales bacterium]|nr:helix-turn-helix transcriptional regulator [Thermomicrobiales bacterium]